MNATLSQHLQQVLAGGYFACEHTEGNQVFIEVKDVATRNPSWTKPLTNILISIPANYPIQGLDAFYAEKDCLLTEGQKHKRMQNEARLLSRDWWLVSWHYHEQRPWNPNSDNIVTHINHCCQFFKQGARSD